MAGGSAVASHIGNQVELDLTGATSITIRTRGGSNSIVLSNVTSTGLLHGLNAPTATLAGTLSAPGAVGMIKLASITGIISAGAIANISAASLTGSVSAAGAIGVAKFGVINGTIAAAVIRNLSAGSISGASILAGANLGADGVLGGSVADIYGPGQIFTVNVTGGIANSLIGAGVNPADGIFGNGNDASAGGGLIKAITVKGGIDNNTRFEASAFPKVIHIPAKASPVGDARFVVLS